MKISAIIPCYNEEKNVARVIESLFSSPLISEIIAVNDGSKDKTEVVLRSFGKKIVLLSFKKNRGKGAAITEGIRKAKNDLILFIDADLHGLKPSHLQQMVNCYLKNKADGVIGDLVNWSKEVFYWEIFNKISRKIIKYDFLSGERLYPKKSLIPLLAKMKTLGYGLEVFLNNEFKNKKISVVRLKNVSQSPKEEKNGFTYTTFRAYLKEGLEISKELARQQNIKGKEIIRFQKKYLFQFAKAYVKSGQKWKKIFNKHIFAYLTTS